MMGRRKSEQSQLFYAFDLEAVLPDDHQVRRIAAVLDLAWVRTELAPHHSHTGRPSIDPELMIRMLILGYVFAIRSERPLRRFRLFKDDTPSHDQRGDIFAQTAAPCARQG